jgi:hypothetical protein
MKDSHKAIATFIVLAITFILVFASVSFWVLTTKQPFFITYPPANTTYTDGNYTQSLHLSVQAVPTVVNGITAVTSIIVAFTGGYIGIMLRELPDNTEADKTFRIFLMIFVPLSIGIIIVLDIIGYINLVEGGILFPSALLDVIGGLLWALLILLGTFIFVGFRLDKQQKSNSFAKCQSLILPKSIDSVNKNNEDSEDNSERQKQI